MRRQEHKPAANIPKDRGKAERIEQTRVVKKLSVTQPGALKLAQRYGEALVCVRYRHDAERRYRYTTIELVVERAPIKRRNPALDAIVVVRIPFGDTERQLQAQACGARWDSKSRVWYMRYGTAKQLGLQKQIVEKLIEVER